MLSRGVVERSLEEEEERGREKKVARRSARDSLDFAVVLRGSHLMEVGVDLVRRVRQRDMEVGREESKAR